MSGKQLKKAGGSAAPETAEATDFWSNPLASLGFGSSSNEQSKAVAEAAVARPESSALLSDMLGADLMGSLVAKAMDPLGLVAKAVDPLGLASHFFGSEGSEEVPDWSEYTPEYVEAHREELGIPAGAPIEDWFTEFIAHQVTGGEGLRSEHCTAMLALEAEAEVAGDVKLDDEKQRKLDLWLQEKGLLEAWGYDPIIKAGEDGKPGPQEVKDDDTGLYAVRYDATEKGREAGRGSIMSFRGTQPGEEQTGGWGLGWLHDQVCDLWSDAQGTVGKNQFENNDDDIEALMKGGQRADGREGVQTLTGHSLGGFLAQHSAAAFTDNVDDVVTFQGGGIGEEEAEQFKKKNSDGRVGVRHHYAGNTDVVHSAGEARLGGKFFNYKSDEWQIGHFKGLMFGESGKENGVLQKLLGNTSVSESATDTVDSRFRHAAEFGRVGGGALGQAFMAPHWAAVALGKGARAQADHLHSNIENIGSTLGTGVGNLRTDAGQAASSITSAGASGDGWGAVRAGASGLGTMAAGVGDTTKGVGSGLTKLGTDSAWDIGATFFGAGAMGAGVKATAEEQVSAAGEEFYEFFRSFV